MTNPWLDIAVDDYVGHMSSPDVGQSQVLKRLFGEILREVRPRSVLVLGCSTGNGFEHIDPAATSRVVGVDINPQYLQRLVERIRSPGFSLDLQCTDLSRYAFEPAAFDLVHAALVFEYVEWIRLLPRISETLRFDGVLSVVLQTPSPVTPAVTPTRFTSLGALESIFRFVDPDVLIEEAAACGLSLEWRRSEQLNAGKAFGVLAFRKVPSKSPPHPTRGAETNS
jgi:SAM-dependent methyltransferase